MIMIEVNGGVVTDVWEENKDGEILDALVEGRDYRVIDNDN